ncbi:MAG: 4Fe-4S binding protein [Bacteroidales bacterium]|nr:4Fe-4S binding protein [Bacteroidales bacterium]
MISRRQMLGYCLAGMAGFALWRLRRYSNLIPITKNKSEPDRLTASGTDSNSLTEHIKEELIRQGADLVGIGDLTELPNNSRSSLPFGICVAVKYPKEVISGIIDLPTREYYDWYNTVNSRLHSLATFAVVTLEKLGYKATTRTSLPHKTIATRAGIGWIGKSALLVTESYGSMIRLSSILTDAPLTAAAPINQSKCGDCMICANACPAGALSGRLWNTTVQRNEILDTSKCSAMAIKRSVRGFGIPIELCGKCIAVCQYTQQYIKELRKTG